MDSEWKQCERTDKRDKDPLTPPSAFPPTALVRLSTRAQSSSAPCLYVLYVHCIYIYIYIESTAWETRSCRSDIKPPLFTEYRDSIVV